MLVQQLIAEAKLNQREALQAIGLTRSTYHYKAKPGGRRLRPLDEALCSRIYGVIEHAAVYGYRKVYHTLRAHGLLVNHKKVLRHTQRLGLTQPRKIKGRVYTHPEVRHPTVSNDYWEMDLTYVWCGTEQGYLFSIIDACDRGIPGDCFSDRCRSQEAEQALQKAVNVRFGDRVPMEHRLVLRIDRGPQFIARRFRNAALRLGVEIEYAGIKCPDDKPYIESFIGKYKVEEVYRNEYRNLEEARLGWDLYRAWHENERLHQALNYQTPKTVLAQSQKTMLDYESKKCNIYKPLFCPK